jgi:hypothetical protein
MCRLHLHGRKIHMEGIALAAVLVSLMDFLPWRCRRHVPPKRQCPQEACATTSHKEEFCKVRTVHAIIVQS